MPRRSPLAGHQILIAEDNPLIMVELVDLLEAAGAKAFSAADEREAVRQVRASAFSAALLDIRLGDRDCSAICRELSRRGVPFMFYTGGSSEDAAKVWPGTLVLTKPASGREIVRMLRSLVSL